MADAVFWGIMAISVILILIMIASMVLFSRKIESPEYSEWREELAEWKEKHPIWNVLVQLPIFATFFIILNVIIGPQRPILKPNSEEEAVSTEVGYSPASKILEDGTE